MPELPEVELVRRGLIATVVDHRVEGVEVHSRNSLTVPIEQLERVLVGRKLTGVERRGKLLIIDLDRDAHLLVHLMMTGQLVVTDRSRTLFAGGHPSRSMLGPMPNATTRVVFVLDRGRLLFFNDARKFGRIGLLDSTSLQANGFIGRLGPEPLESSFTLDRFRAQLRRHRRASIKAVILDQSVVAGIGNIYADESLHLARVHPARRAGELTPPESQHLHAAIKTTIELAIESGGTSFAATAETARSTGYLAKDLCR